MLFQVPLVSLTMWDFKNPVGADTAVGRTPIVLCVLGRFVTYMWLLVAHLRLFSGVVLTVILSVVALRTKRLLRRVSTVSVEGLVTLVFRRAVTLTVVLRCLVCAVVDARRDALAGWVLVEGPVVSVQVTLQVLQRVVLRYQVVELMHVISLDLFSSLVVNATVVSSSDPMGKPGKTWKAVKPWESELGEGGELRKVLAQSLHDVLMP